MTEDMCRDSFKSRRTWSCSASRNLEVRPQYNSHVSSGDHIDALGLEKTEAQRDLTGGVTSGPEVKFRSLGISELRKLREARRQSSTLPSGNFTCKRPPPLEHVARLTGRRFSRFESPT